ncbi:hypothetical protein EWB00_010233 [Schistosoma japonicum]|uniref:Clone ZZD1273 mRNA sequence n=1 Tax=Schistosoma japonicum TaxID=6182 RepID=Q86EZ3_SCHJA|nr:hypothetical protein [Schistosoma japonicum]KAH8862562.1 hypothetical protein KSF78_0002372 [Schistosoma japonicum]KAH8862565.1 hypothetical protein KSF78_0002372 [Schistosoma japonicum]TNN18446.1 hypothetical protein EWB00_010233 [Schistosoma japonicum]CAX70800.1 hypothetical protein [Schistosoma japonicum]
MPRRSSNTNSEESPVTRRTSARIAAAQAASPAKSPAKSPRRKRQSTEPVKAASEDTESQQSQVKSESSMEELNGIDVSSSKHTELLHDQVEIPHKKVKADKESDNDQLSSDHEKNEDEALKKNDTDVSQTQDSNTTSTDFEIVEHSSVPPPDSAEVQAAISTQGEDGHLLVGFVQVNKEELPAPNSSEIKQVSATLESCNATVTCGSECVAKADHIVEPSVNTPNGNVGSQESSKDEPSKPNGTVHVEAHHKTPIPIEEPVIQPLVGHVTGDIALDAVSEMISQQ